MAIIPIAKMVNMMAIIQSVSPIESAAKSERNWLFVLAAWIVISALVTGVLTVLLYKKTGKYQETVKVDADARIAEAGTKAATANERAAVANAQAAKANEGLAKSNEKIARLTKEGEQAKTERAEADKQIAIAKADAARAKEGIANAEAVSAKASVEVARLQVVVANAEQKRAEAERSLLEVRERLRWRTLSAKQDADFVSALRAFPGGVIDLGYTASGGDEASSLCRHLLALFKKAGWTVRNEKSLTLRMDIEYIGVGLLVRGAPGATEFSLTPALVTLQSALKTVGIEAQFVNWQLGRDETVEVLVGSKPQP